MSNGPMRTFHKKGKRWVGAVVILSVVVAFLIAGAATIMHGSRSRIANVDEATFRPTTIERIHLRLWELGWVKNPPGIVTEIDALLEQTIDTTSDIVDETDSEVKEIPNESGSP